MHAVFYRNLNLGHRGSPTRAQFEDCLLGAGATRAKSFQTNGTALITAADPQSVVRQAAEPLEQCSGYVGTALVRTVVSLREVLDANHFDGHTDEQTYRETFTFFGGGRSPAWSLPWTNQRGDVRVILVAEGLALGVIRATNGAGANVTAEVEKATGGVATTRTKGTIERLVKAAESW